MLSTKGYLVIPQFLNSEEVTLLVKDFTEADTSSNTNYKLSFVKNDKLKDTINNKIQKLLTNITSPSGPTVDTPVPGIIYMDTTYLDFGWHQDHESFYLLQQNYDYLNFYIPLIKPDANKTGLSVIPMDALNNPLLVNHGASRFLPIENDTVMVDDTSGEESRLGVNIEDLMESPKLLPGDLLLLRGDVIHRTQDNLTRRLAISTRWTNGNRVINKNKLLDGCEFKQRMIQGNKNSFNTTMKVFQIYGSEEMTAKEFYRIKDELFRKSN